MEQAATRRSVLRLLAGAPLLAAGVDPAVSGDAPLIGRLIREAKALPQVSQRMDFISRALLGVKYQANTLIGGPRHREVFVVREDAFDCVTFCEIVVAAAIAHDFVEFESSLRRIRYEHGGVRWDERNHYFAEWSRRIVENQICRAVVIEPAVTIDKTVNWQGLGRRRVSMVGIPRTIFLNNKHLLSSGDLIGFISKRPNLDFFHTGLVAFGPDNSELLLRHASKSRGRILDERMETFVLANAVKYVTLLRAADDAPPAVRT